MIIKRNGKDTYVPNASSGMDDVYEKIDNYIDSGTYGNVNSDPELTNIPDVGRLDVKLVELVNMVKASKWYVQSSKDSLFVLLDNIEYVTTEEVYGIIKDVVMVENDKRIRWKKKRLHYFDVDDNKWKFS